jgi:replicative superfamily II helicase
MVDFKKLRAAKPQTTVIDPVEIFRRLPKPPGITDLYVSQAEVLTEWFARRNERDVVVKLHTGGGKTLVGLLIAQSILNETKEPVLYVCPTVQLVDQTLAKAGEYGISAVPYVKKEDFAEEFTGARGVMVCVYQALFNGNSRFGIRGGGREITNVGGIILDDAHVAFSTVRDQFTLRIEKKTNNAEYEEITGMFRYDFQELGRGGTFDDVLRGSDRLSILEVPYWSWRIRAEQAREYLQGRDAGGTLQWLFLRDAFQQCHCLITSTAIVVTPIFPLVDLVPTFADCSRRVFMSATIGDDSAIIRTFDADRDSIGRPITSKSLAGVSERMILIPELTALDGDAVRPIVDKIVGHIAGKRNEGVVILVPSEHASSAWDKTGKFASSTDQVSNAVAQLQQGKSAGPFVFANRYDGIDLPGPACRLLIMSGLPRGVGEYELHRANTFLGGSELDSTLAQRLEQGMGRGARGASDYCVVLLLGKDLIAWLSRSKNQALLTSSTNAQFEIGRTVSKNVSDAEDLSKTVGRCLKRDREWMEYHAEQLAELASPVEAKAGALDTAAVERAAFRLFREGYLEKAIEKLAAHISAAPKLDPKSKGWLLQIAARIADAWGNLDRAQQLQQHAYSENKNLLRPKVLPPYVAAHVSGKQAQEVVRKIAEFGYRRGYLAYFDETVSNLTASSSANQFEEGLAELGRILGFYAERPENDHQIGPDVLWLLDGTTGLIIEAKSRKNEGNALTKDQHGQLLNAAEWFRATYPSYTGVRISVHPKPVASPRTVTGASKALTLDRLNGLIADARSLLETLCTSAAPDQDLVPRAETLLGKTRLNPTGLVEKYMVPFESK